MTDKITDLMKTKYGLTHISNTINITAKDTLYTIYKKTAKYIYKNGVQNGDFTDQDEIAALAKKANVSPSQLKKVNTNLMANDEKEQYVELLKLKNTKKDRWEDHVYELVDEKNHSKDFFFIKPNGTVPKTYNSSRRYWTRTNDAVKRAIEHTNTTLKYSKWLTRADNYKESSHFTAYSRDTLIGYSKLSEDLTKTLSKNKSLNQEICNRLISDLENPYYSGRSHDYVFAQDLAKEIFKKKAHTPTYDEWKKAKNTDVSPLKYIIDDENDNGEKKTRDQIETELSEYLINDNRLLSKDVLTTQLNKNKVLGGIENYLKDTYNLTLQADYNALQSQSIHAKYFQTKKNINRETQHKMDDLSKKLSKSFKAVEIDNDVDLKELDKFIPELQQTLKVLPQANNGAKPILRFRKLKNHKALGMYNQINNTIAIDFRERIDKETGLQSFVHEYGHFLDFNEKCQPSLLDPKLNPTLKATQTEIDNIAGLDKKVRQYLKTPTEIYARAFEMYVSHAGLDNSTIKNKETYNSKESPKFSTFTYEIKKQLYSYFDNKYPKIRSSIEKLNQETTLDHQSEVEVKENKIVNNTTEESQNNKLVDLPKHEVNRQAYLISRGRMQPSSNDMIMDRVKKIESKKKQKSIDEMARKTFLKNPLTSKWYKQRIKMEKEIIYQENHRGYPIDHPELNKLHKIENRITPHEVNDLNNKFVATHEYTSTEVKTLISNEIESQIEQNAVKYDEKENLSIKRNPIARQAAMARRVEMDR